MASPAPRTSPKIRLNFARSFILVAGTTETSLTCLLKPRQPGAFASYTTKPRRRVQSFAPQSPMVLRLRFVRLAEAVARICQGVPAVRINRSLQPVSLALGGSLQIRDHFLVGIDLFGSTQRQVPLPDILQPGRMTEYIEYA